MKNLKLLTFALLTFALTGCARGCQSLERKTMGNHRIRVCLYSGGKLITNFEFTGVINSSEHSDGYYFYNNDGRLVEISGDVIIYYLD